MTRRIFLFREQEGYTQREKIDRIPSSALVSEEAEEFIQKEVDGEIDPSDYRKEDFFLRLRNETDEQTRERFVDSLFEVHGKKGDTFNFRLFRVGDALSHRRIHSNIQDVLDSRLDEIYPDIFGNQALTVTRTAKDEENQLVDFAAKTAVRNQDINPDEEVPIQIIRSDDGSIEKEYGPEFFVRAPSSDRIEVRTYADAGIVGVSNRTGITKSLQESLAKLVTVLNEEDQ